MVYRFHEDEHGEVIAEDLDPKFDPYLGLHYPATDIPAPARRVFLLNWLRIIPVADYKPVPIRVMKNSATNEVDLSRSLLRSVSPIHIEYLKNMGTKATLTLSLIHQNKLWGLITCANHSSSKFVSIPMRHACEVAAKLMSALLPIKEEAQQLQQRTKVKAVSEELVSLTENHDNLDLALLDQSPNLLDLISAHGVASCLNGNKDWKVLGITPTVTQISESADWLRKLPKSPIRFFDSLPSVFPNAKEYAEKGSGLLSIEIPISDGGFILWFRPEVIQICPMEALGTRSSSKFTK